MGGFRWGCLIGLACGGGELDAEPVDGGQQCAVLFPGGLGGLGVEAEQGVDPVALDVELGEVSLDAVSGGGGAGAGGEGGGALGGVVTGARGVALSCAAAVVMSRSSRAARWSGVYAADCSARGMK